MPKRPLPRPVYDQDGITLYHGDCRALLPRLGLDESTVVVTDPPYGVGFTGKAGNYRNEPHFKSDLVYASHDDTPDDWIDQVYPTVEACAYGFEASAFFMVETRLCDMPRGGNVGGFFMPNGCGRSAWGFQCFMHVCFYGKCPYLKRGLGARPNGKYGVYGNDSNLEDHPCAKPLRAVEWVVNRVSMLGDVVFDPYAGSGTTAIACMKSGRRFIGIEIDPLYIDVAISRIKDHAEGAGTLTDMKKQLSRIRMPKGKKGK